MSRPLAITMGDASGVGPEVLLRSYAEDRLPEDAVAYGDAAILEAGCKLLGLSLLIHRIESPDALVAGRLNVVDLGRLDASDLTGS